MTLGYYVHEGMGLWSMKKFLSLHGPKSFNLLPNLCLDVKGLKLDCGEWTMCVPEWEGSDGDVCQTYQEKKYCTEEGMKLS